MSTRKSFVLAAAASLLLTASAALDAAPAPTRVRPVMRMRFASVTVSQTPNTIRICARGLVPTAGWTNARLQPVSYADGIYDINFVATAPAGNVPQVTTLIKASLLYSPYPATLKGVTVHAAANTATAMLGQGPSAC